LAEQTADIVKFNTAKKNIEFLLNVQLDIPKYVVLDQIRIKQILVNLLSNAIKFTEKGEVELSISFEETDPVNQEGIFTFSIRDTGIGISSEQQAKLFKSFTQADSSTTRKFGGTGLGLVISQMLAEKMDSTIILKSELNKGSAFSFSIIRKFKRTSPPEYNGVINIEKLLIIDDNTNNRTILEHIISHWNIKTQSVDNAISALTLLDKDPHFDVLIVDYHMPFMDGITTIAEIKKLFAEKQHGKLPKIILYSSADDARLEHSIKELKIDAKLVKPAKISELFFTLNKISDHPSPEPIQGIGNKISDKPTNSEGFKILIAEDVSLNMLLLKTIIKSYFPDSVIIECSNGKEAVDQFKKGRPDLVFMDVQMPVMDGFEATLQIRNIGKEEEKYVPIIALTAGALHTEREKCLQVGMDHFLTKPIDKEKLIEVMERVLKSIR